MVEPRPMSFRRTRLLWNCVAEARPRGFPPRCSLDSVSSTLDHRFNSIFIGTRIFSNFFLLVNNNCLVRLGRLVLLS